MELRARGGLVEIPGYPFALWASAGTEDRARSVADRCARAREFLSEAFSVDRPEITLLVLSKEDWGTNAPGPPYGMPHYRDGRLVVAGTDSEFWTKLLAMLDRADPELRRKVDEVYSTPGGTNLSPFFDLLAVHELAHAFHLQNEGSFFRLWLQELFANLCVHTYIASAVPDQLPLLVTFPHAFTSIDPHEFRHRSLRDFDRLYSGVGDANYAWYQCGFHVAAQRLHDQAGAECVRRLWRAFFSLSDLRLIGTLERDVDPLLAEAFLGWPG